MVKTRFVNDYMHAQRLANTLNDYPIGLVEVGEKSLTAVSLSAKKGVLHPPLDSIDKEPNAQDPTLNFDGAIYE